MTETQTHSQRHLNTLIYYRNFFNVFLGGNRPGKNVTIHLFLTHSQNTPNIPL